MANKNKGRGNFRGVPGKHASMQRGQKSPEGRKNKAINGLMNDMQKVEAEKRAKDYQTAFDKAIVDENFKFSDEFNLAQFELSRRIILTMVCDYSHTEIGKASSVIGLEVEKIQEQGYDAKANFETLSLWNNYINNAGKPKFAGLSADSTKEEWEDYYSLYHQWENLIKRWNDWRDETLEKLKEAYKPLDQTDMVKFKELAEKKYEEMKAAGLVNQKGDIISPSDEIPATENEVKEMEASAEPTAEKTKATPKTKAKPKTKGVKPKAKAQAKPKATKEPATK